jgi:hypothetical protein
MCTISLLDIVLSGGEMQSHLICKPVNPPPENRELPVFKTQPLPAAVFVSFGDIDITRKFV